MHAGEVYVSEPDLAPTTADIQHYSGDTDLECIAGADIFNAMPVVEYQDDRLQVSNLTE